MKRKAAQDKLLRQGRSQQDKISQIGAEVGDAERKVHQARLLFEDMGRLMHGELDRFEREKVEDFKSGVETFLEGGVEAQKEVRYCIVCEAEFGTNFPFPQLIEIWETYLMQLDAEDDENFGLASPPAGVVASPTMGSKDAVAERPHTASTVESEEASEARATAVATREVE